jgi:hypothetical protein
MNPEVENYSLWCAQVPIRFLVAHRSLVIDNRISFSGLVQTDVDDIIIPEDMNKCKYLATNFQNLVLKFLVGKEVYTIIYNELGFTEQCPILTTGISYYFSKSHIPKWTTENTDLVNLTELLKIVCELCNKIEAFTVFDTMETDVVKIKNLLSADRFERYGLADILRNWSKIYNFLTNKEDAFARFLIFYHCYCMLLFTAIEPNFLNKITSGYESLIYFEDLPIPRYGQYLSLALGFLYNLAGMKANDIEIQLNNIKELYPLTVIEKQKLENIESIISYERDLYEEYVMYKNNSFISYSDLPEEVKNKLEKIYPFGCVKSLWNNFNLTKDIPPMAIGYLNKLTHIAKEIDINDFSVAICINIINILSPLGTDIKDIQKHQINSIEDITFKECCNAKIMKNRAVKLSDMAIKANMDLLTDINLFYKYVIWFDIPRLIKKLFRTPKTKLPTLQCEIIVPVANGLFISISEQIRAIQNMENILCNLQTNNSYINEIITYESCLMSVNKTISSIMQIEKNITQGINDVSPIVKFLEFHQHKNLHINIINKLLIPYKEAVPYENIIKLVNSWYTLLEQKYDQSIKSYFCFLSEDKQLMEFRNFIHIYSFLKNNLSQNDISIIHLIKNKLCLNIPDQHDEDSKDYFIDIYRMCVGNFGTDISKWVHLITPFNISKAKRQLFSLIESDIDFIYEKFLLSKDNKNPEDIINLNIETFKVLEQNLVTKIKTRKISELDSLNILKSKIEAISLDFKNQTNNILDNNINAILSLIDRLMIKSLHEYEAAAVFRILADIMTSPVYGNMKDNILSTVKYFFGGFARLLSEKIK